MLEGMYDRHKAHRASSTRSVVGVEKNSNTHACREVTREKGSLFYGGGRAKPWETENRRN